MIIKKTIAQLNALWQKQPLTIIALVFTLGSLAIFFHIERLNIQLIESTTIASSRQYADVLNQFRSLYTSEVVATIANMGIEVSHDYYLKDNAIPLPATLSLLLGEKMGVDGLNVKARLYSAYPFPWRTDSGGLKGDFEQSAWTALNRDPSQAYVRIEEVDGVPSVRYAIADVMRPACVSCHNEHLDSPKTDWATGDVRGVLEVIEPIAAGISQVNTIFLQMVFMVSSLLFLGLLGFSLAIKRQRVINRQLDTLNHQLSGEIDERIKTETALKLATDKATAEAIVAKKAKSVFLANISHEIRTPMNAILGYNQILQRDAKMNDDQQHSLSIISKSGEHLMGLINDVLDLSKVEAGKTQIMSKPFDLVELCNTINDMFKLKAQQKDIAWQSSTDISASKLIVVGDQGKIRQVLINLIGNSIKFTHAGFVHFTLNCKADNRFSFEISDTGIGIPKQDQQAVFGAFNQGSIAPEFGGTGLGLAISKKYIALLSGELALESEPGKGCRFYFDLPLLVVDTELLTEDQVPIEHLKESQSKSILVIDDIALNRNLLTRMLTDVGFTVFEADNGKTGLALIEHQVVDLIFTDLMMPIMDGEHLLHAIKKTHPTLPVVAISASTLHVNLQYYVNIGFDGFIAKPFDFDDIYNLLAKLLQVEFYYTAPRNIASIDVDMVTEFMLTLTQADELIKQCELYRVSEIEKSLHQYAQEQPGHDQYFARLQKYVNRYDFDGLRHFLIKEHDEQLH